MSGSENQTLEIIHYALAEAGFKRCASTKGNIYENTITKSNIDFAIRVHIEDPYFVKKPLILLVDRPDGLPTLLPHIFFEKALCYLDDRGVEFDRYNPRYNVLVMLTALDALLEQLVSDEESLQAELRRELPAYWQRGCSDPVFMAANGDCFIYELFRRSNLDGELVDEIVLADSTVAAKSWRKKRMSTDTTILTGPGFIFDLPHDISIPSKEWPPDSISKLDQWLDQDNAASARHRLLNTLYMCLAKNESCFILFQLHKMLFGGLVSYSTPATKLAIRRSFKATQPGKRGKSKPLLPGAKRISSLISRLDKLEKGSSFLRFSVNDARVSTISNRNSTTEKSLSSLRIVVVGCGTLGGYTASLLCQSGAGSNGGRIELYDSDQLTTENLSRHILGISYVGENKARALEHYISHQSAGDISIQSHKCNLSADQIDSISQNFDLIVDTTGDISFSTSFCHQMHRCDYPTPVVYGWIDAGGLAARTLLDVCNSNRACYGCLKTRSTEGITSERFKLFKAGATLPEWRPRPCGLGGYMPFSSQAPATAAGLILNQCLDWVNGSPSPHFRHISLDARVCETKDADIRPLLDCPCCRIE
ncbi:ThiF family adenylyltransferase [Parahaliea aestuarii]|uniref:Uncharacterized protein n=1 Tax=Parahaliea aestuarii TaxID=1852021 RepID=A0A5C8ZQM1_9GAMM|nr:ThiF family adenylyltransferase [Parahaliea aestuarii]TXS90635.1 hypothetical protein FVW59_14985 [Parahaliea aestuarii]